MKRVWRIGSLFGVSIRIDWSWLLIFVVITYNLAAFLGQLYPAWEVTIRWMISAAAALLFFASVLAHELAHALLARVYGVPVLDITLFFMGGVANLQREPPRPKAEFMIALAGPLTSLGLGMVGLLAGQGLLRLPAGIARAYLPPASTILLWLGVVNLLLAALNMIPGFPLDGGRVLRSVLWGLTGSYHRATRWAAWAGQAVAWMIMAVGSSLLFGISLPWIGSGLATGLWLILIGWFLNTASAVQYHQALLRQRLEGVPVAYLMRRDTPTTSPGWLVSELDPLLPLDQKDFALPVLAEQRLVGIVTAQDVARLPRDAWAVTRVDQMMTAGEQLETIAPHEDASSAMDRLLQHDIRMLPVVRENCEFLGMLRQRDILRWLQAHQEAGHV